MQIFHKRPFPGGVHPTDGKDKALSAGKEIRPFRPGQVWISMEQTPGGRCEPLVREGDRVRRGQKIGEPQTFTASAVHASISGAVTGLRTAKGTLYCAIRGDEEQPSPLGRSALEPVDAAAFGREEIIAAIREGGLVGMGGAGFPAAVKYETKAEIDTLLLNGAECEPFLTCDDRLMTEQPLAVLNGAMLLKKAAGAGRAVLCLEDNKPEAARALEEALRLFEDPPELKILPTRYPQGGERQLIQAVTGREVPAGGLPADAGVIVSNVATARTAAAILMDREPLTSRVVTVTGGVKEPQNFLAPIGASLQELIAAAGGVNSRENRVILGGPMTGRCIARNYDGETEIGFVTKTTSGIVVLPPARLTESPCIRCGGCASVCPAGLTPWKIDFAERAGDGALCERLDADACIGCGCCSYICPARRELARHTILARDRVRAMQRERRNA